MIRDDTCVQLQHITLELQLRVCRGFKCWSTEKVLQPNCAACHARRKVVRAERYTNKMKLRSEGNARIACK